MLPYINQAVTHCSSQWVAVIIPFLFCEKPSAFYAIEHVILAENLHDQMMVELLKASGRIRYQGTTPNEQTRPTNGGCGDVFGDERNWTCHSRR